VGFGVEGFGVDGFGVDGFGVDGFGVEGFGVWCLVLRVEVLGSRVQGRERTLLGASP
jgi:hypothetical protein